MPLRNCFPCFESRNVAEVVNKLDYSNTNLSEEFPNIWQFENTLEELNLSSTRIHALPPQLFYCLGLHVLLLNNNNLVELPSAIGTLRNLVQLSLNKNALSSVPDTIKLCKNLTYLDLSCNNLQRLPEAITSLISLQELLLNETCLEFLPANFGRLVNLRVLELRLNSLLTLPKSMVRLSNLFRIDIGSNEFTELPEVIGELKHLKELWIDFNRIRRISSNIGNLSELKHFEAKGNYLSVLPDQISNWRQCELLSVCTNGLESLPISIGSMKWLVTLNCEHCEVTELPDSITHLENLEELVISHNNLQRLPLTIGFLKKLKVLFADNNQITYLPDDICNCISISVLSISCNQIEQLPKDIGRMINLKVLNIVNNCIASLPVSIINLVNLTSLWISENQSKPLVPLQYLDGCQRTHLTCFMLPQIKIAENIHTTKLMKTKSESDQHSDLIEGQSTRRICFAENVTTFIGTFEGVEAVGNSRLFSSKNTLDKNETIPPRFNENMRLMRSPTPYPKELRQMAKGLLQSDHNLASHNTINQVNIREAKVFFHGSSSNNANIHNTLYKGLPLPIKNEISELNASLEKLNTSDNYKNFCNINSLSTKSNSEHLGISESNKSEITSGIIESSPVTFCSLPPPYHIAKNFTKKSVADLTNYESMRILNELKSKQLPNFEESVDNKNTNEGILYDVLDNHKVCEPEISAKYFKTQDNIQQHSDKNVENNNYAINTLVDKDQMLVENKKSTWLFGLHKNPTVKQVSVKIENFQVGFDIKESTSLSKNGIFVASLVPCSHAARVLNVDDKLLEINGIDFTSIGLSTAKNILSNSGPIINIMFSRK